MGGKNTFYMNRGKQKLPSAEYHKIALKYIFPLNLDPVQQYSAVTFQNSLLNWNEY